MQARYDTAPDKFPTLQSFVESEIADGTNKGSKSCTVGLLWLKRYIKSSNMSMSMIISERSESSTYIHVCAFGHRALEFICIFLEAVVAGEEDLVKCAHKAYNESLKKYHGWIVSGIFSVSLPLFVVIQRMHKCTCCIVFYW